MEIYSRTAIKVLHLVGAWWGAVQKLEFTGDMIQFSMSIVTASPATASLERIFLTLGLTYGKLRAELRHKKAGKLSFLFKDLNKVLVLVLSWVNLNKLHKL